MIIKRLAIGLTMITAWLAIALTTMLTGQIATAAVPLNTSLPQNITVIGRTNTLLIIRSDSPTYVRDLYQTGALFVLPARQKTCLSWQK